MANQKENDNISYVKWKCDNNVWILAFISVMLLVRKISKYLYIKFPLLKFTFSISPPLKQQVLQNIVSHCV